MESNYSFQPVDFNPFEGSELEKVVQISEPQKEIWLSCILGGSDSSLAYNLSISVKFEGTFNPDAFEKSLLSVVSRHESLRTTCNTSGDYLMIHKDILVEISKIDLSNLDRQQQEAEIKNHLDLEMRTPFDLLNGPLFRFFLQKINRDEYLFTLVIHHIIADGWSMGIILGDIARYYSAYTTGSALPTELVSQISDYNEEEAHYKESNHYLETEQYWLDVFKSKVPVTDLPTDRSRPSPRSYNGNRYDFRINTDQVKRIKSLGAPSGATLVITLLSAFELFIHKKTGQDQIIIGLPTAGQAATENFSLVGHCVNLLPLQSELDRDLTFNEHLRIRKEKFFDAYEHQRITFGELVRKLKIKRDDARIPLVPIMFNVNLGMDTSMVFEGLNYTLISNPRPFETFEIFLNINNDKDALVLEWSYNTNLFNAATISEMADDFYALLNELVEKPNLEIKKLDYFRSRSPQLTIHKENSSATANDKAITHKINILPQTSEEKLIARLWTEALGLNEDIYLHDDFFDLGGHSLTAVQVLLKLEKETGKRLPMTSIFNNSTINEFVELLNFDKSDIQTDTLSYHNTDYNNLQDTFSLQGNTLLSDTHQNPSYRSEFTFIDIFHNISIQYPESPAIIFQDKAILYKEINNRSNQLANILIGQGIKRGDIIGLALDRSPELIISLLGIMKSGAAYIPLDPQYPADRLIFMLEDSAAKMLITSNEYTGKFGQTPEVLLTDLWSQGPFFTTEYPEITVAESDLAYVLYTSGSTGKPKGVQIEHHSLLNFLQSMKKEPGMSNEDSILAITTISFDIAGLELYLPLICGAKIILASSEDRIDTQSIFQIIEKENVSMMQATPATWRMMLNDNWKKKYAIKALCGGESLPKDLAEKLLQRCDSLWNLYGPTETTIWSTVKQITSQDDVVTIGRPIDNTQIYILGQDWTELPVNTPGEIYIGGDGVARGYLNRPELTSERFIDNPIASSSHSKIYRTGDLGQWLPSGEIVCLGRVDNQVKIRGYRIELGEIEHHLNKIDDIKEAVVIAREDIPGDQRLVAYVISQDQAGNIADTGENVDRNRVKIWKEQLREHLPAYMLPNDWVELSSFPLTPNLKIDRKLLPATLNLNAEQGTSYNLADVLIVPATEPQIEIWLAYLIGKENASRAYNLPVGIEFTGNLDRFALAEALQEVVNRHELLRSNFSKEGIEIHIHKHIKVELDYEDISNLNTQEQKSKIDHLHRLNAENVFNLFHAPLFKANLIKLNDHKHNFLFTVHHSSADGWSLGIIFSELGRIYNSLVNHETPSLAKAPLFSEYSIEKQKFYQTDEYQRIEKFWIDQFKDNVPSLELPTDFTRPKDRSFKGKRIYYNLDGQLFKKIVNMSSSSGCSLAITFRAALEVFLYRLTGQQELVTGMPFAGQLGTDYEAMVAHCVNLLPLKVTVDCKVSFLEHLKKRRKYLLDAFDNKDLTFSSLLKKLNLSRDESRVPLVSVMMNYDYKQNDADFQGLTLQNLPTQKVYENFDISINIEESDSDLKIRWDYNTDLFTESTISQLNEAFALLLKAVTDQPDIQVDHIPLFDREDLIKKMNIWNNTFTPYDKSKTVSHLISEIANHYPDRTAVTFAQKQTSYEVLENQSNQFARLLISKGIQIGDKIGLALDRSTEMLVSLLAIMKAGAAYIPLDPLYPIDRIDYMLADSDAKMLITSKNYKHNFTSNATELLINEVWQDLDSYDVSVPEITITGENLAYILYTSGSTGMPKGVQIEHHSLTNFLLSMKKKPGVHKDDVILAITTISFDIAGLELYLPLITGAKIALADSNTARDGAELLQFIRNTNVTIAQATPSTWRMLLDAGWENPLPVKALCGGEALTRDLADQLLKKCDSLWNMYGPTETTVWSTLKEISRDEEVISIGRPIDNTGIYILDGNQIPTIIGSTGEICIAGDGVARGYLNRTELNSEKFTSLGLMPEKNKIYRTGDLGKFLPNGEILCLGRIDQQVKLRGHRIELEEIEQQIAKLDGIKAVVVALREDYPGDQHLVAYVITGSETLSKDEIDLWKNALKGTLPYFMIPGNWMAIQKIPFTSNNKINRKALPKPIDRELVNKIASNRPLIGKNEYIIANIWSNLLKIQHIKPTDDFFDLGGHSLIAAKAMRAIELETGKRLPLATLFDNSTLEKLAKLIESDEKDLKWDSLVPIKTTGSKTPLYIVHGWGLNVLRFGDLAKFISDDQPIYGLQAKGLDGKSTSKSSIEQIAANYIAEILEQNPKGPYYISGYSSGGVIAFEMAKQLKEAGKEIPFLGLFDTFVEKPLEAHNKNGVLGIIEYLFKKIYYSIIFFIRHPKSFINDKISFTLGTLYNFYAKFKPKKEDLPESFDDIILKLKWQHDHSIKQYKYQPYDGHAYLFKANNPETTYFPHFKTNGWKPFLQKGVTIIHVDAVHVDYFKPSSIESLASKIQQALNDAKQKYDIK